MGRVSPAVLISCWAIGVLAMVLTVAASVLPSLLGADSYHLPSESGLLVWVVASSVLGLILVVRAGAVRMGALMLVIGLAGAMAALGEAVPLDPAHVAWLPVIPVSGVGWVTFLGLTIAGIPLLFPTGTPPSRRWRPVLWLLIGSLVLAAFMSAFSDEVWVYCSDVFPGETPCSAWETVDEGPAIANCEPVAGPLGDGTECRVTFDNPIGIAGVPQVEDSLLGNIGFAGLLVTAALSIISLGVRMRHARRQERQQIKLVFLVLGALIAFTLVEVVLVEVLGGGDLPGTEIIELVTWLAIPVSIFLAITRYRLYEIDKLISRTVSYAVVVALLATVVGVVATLVGTRFTDPRIVAATTLGVAGLFNPLRRRVQGWVDRRFNRSTYDAERVMDGFAGSLRERVEPDGVVEGLLDVVSDTMQPVALGLWVRR